MVVSCNDSNDTIIKTVVIIHVYYNTQLDIISIKYGKTSQEISVFLLILSVFSQMLTTIFSHAITMYVYDNSSVVTSNNNKWNYCMREIHFVIEYSKRKKE
jgi:hypothetical protein